MENKDALEYFLAILDEAECVLKGDSFRECSEIVEYSLKEKEAPKSKICPVDDEVSSCHDCALFRNRRIYAEPIYSDKPAILFIAPYPEGDAILSPAAYDYFTNWFKAIQLERKDVALTTLIKCPSPLFASEYADKCKKHVKEEMMKLRPKAMVLLGEDAARYMLRKQDEFENLRQRRWIVNGIPVYCTYHPEDLVMNPTLRRPIWDDLQLIAKELAV